MATLTEKPTRRKRKNFANAQKVIGPLSKSGGLRERSRQSTDYSGFIILLCCYLAISIAVFVLAGIVLIPGILLIIVGASLVRPRRGIAVTSDGLIVLQESVLEASPNRILMGAPFDALGTIIRDGNGTVQTSVDLEMGAERIRLKRATFETLLLASREFQGPGPYPGIPQGPLPSPAWFPDPSGRNEYRYWNGSGWTNHVSTRGLSSIEPE